MPNKPKHADKQALKAKIDQFLTTPHGKIDEAAEQVAKALTQLIQDENKKNQELFKQAVVNAMSIPQSSHFQSADPQIKSALLAILDLAKHILQGQLTDLAALNEQIKQEKQKLKQRIAEMNVKNTGPKHH